MLVNYINKTYLKPSLTVWLAGAKSFNLGYPCLEINRVNYDYVIFNICQLWCSLVLDKQKKRGIRRTKNLRFLAKKCNNECIKWWTKGASSLAECSGLRKEWPHLKKLLLILAKHLWSGKPSQRTSCHNLFLFEGNIDSIKLQHVFDFSIKFIEEIIVPVIGKVHGFSHQSKLCWNMTKKNKTKYL